MVWVSGSYDFLQVSKVSGFICVLCLLYKPLRHAAQLRTVAQTNTYFSRVNKSIFQRNKISIFILKFVKIL